MSRSPSPDYEPEEPAAKSEEEAKRPEGEPARRQEGKDAGQKRSKGSSGQDSSDDEKRRKRKKKAKRRKTDKEEGQAKDSDEEEKNQNDRDEERRRRRKKREREDKEKEEEKAKKQQQEMLTTRTGGAYIPPAKLRMMQAAITDKSSAQFQRLAWEALKKSINGLINKVNTPNISIIVRELFAENIVRGRGLLCQSIMVAQTASPTFTHVYAALAAIINTRFPNIGELLLKRLILNFKRGFKRNDKTRCMSSTRFIAHMCNQQVAHEVLALEILTLLLESPTDDSVEVGITFLKECGQKLGEVSPRLVL